MSDVPPISESPGQALLPVVQDLSPVPAVTDALFAFANVPNVIVFHSALENGELGRYSFLTADPFEFVDLQRAMFGCDPFSRLRELSARFSAGSIGGLPPFQGGIAGLQAYELGGAWERLPGSPYDEFRMPVLCAGVYDWVVAWDHRLGRAWIVSHGFPETEAAARNQRAAARADWIVSTLRNVGVRPHDRTALRSLPPSALAPQYEVPGPAGLTSDFCREDYLRAVERVVDYIHAGDVFQANLSQRLLYPLRCHPAELFERLALRNAAPFAGYFSHDDWVVVSASPERFLRVSDRSVQTRPIKGTRQRRSVPEADLYTRDELRESEKDRAENVMIVDLLRNDLSRVCQAGSLQVPELCHVEVYETVQHLVSEVRGTLEPDASVWDLFRATVPGGSITGAPKVRAMEIIAELEPTARGPYCGSLFYSGFNGECDSSILIRTFTCRYSWIQCPAGGGIVADSDPEDEYEETLHKADGMLRALE